MDNTGLTASVTVKNEAVKGIPTGEPMRSMVLAVDARCGEQPPATGGDVIPDFGFLEMRTAEESWEIGQKPTPEMS